MGSLVDDNLSMRDISNLKNFFPLELSMESSGLKVHQ